MVKTQQELFDAIKYQHSIGKEITDTLIELDQLPSTGTQVYLNDLLVELYNRVIDTEDDIIVEEFKDKVITDKEFIDWVDSNFTNYSANFFRKTITKE